MTLKLPSSIVSQQDFKVALVEIQQLAKWFDQNAVKQHVLGKQPFDAPSVSATTFDMLKIWFGEKQLSADGLQSLITTMEDFEDKVPYVTITLAAPPPGNLQHALLEWCRQNLNPNILVNFKFNSTLLGGIVVSLGSHTFDWSFRRQILAGRNKFPEVLRRV